MSPDGDSEIVWIRTAVELTSTIEAIPLRRDTPRLGEPRKERSVALASRKCTSKTFENRGVGTDDGDEVAEGVGVVVGVAVGVGVAVDDWDGTNEAVVVGDGVGVDDVVVVGVRVVVGVCVGDRDGTGDADTGEGVAVLVGDGEADARLAATSQRQ